MNRLTYASGKFGALDPVTHLPTQVNNQPYVYDAIGNIQTKGAVTYSYNDLMHPSFVTGTSDGKTYTADANGNTASGGGRSFSWTPDNRVGSVTMNSSATTMDYDYTGARIRKINGSNTTVYPFAGYEIAPDLTKTKYFRIGNEIVGSMQTPGASPPSCDPVANPDYDDDGTCNKRYFYHADHLGGTNVITNKEGTRKQLVEYDPWGKISRNWNNGSDVEPERRFTGQIFDAETGLYYYGARYYDPELARFISPDPIVPSPGDPQSLNRYSYTRNNPVKYIDPSGHSFWSALGNFFKNLFRHPQVFFATLVVGLVTGGLALAALPATIPAFLALGIAGAVGGAFAGLTNAGMTGGNLWQGMLLGAIGGAIGGGVAGAVGGEVAAAGSLLPFKVSFEGVVVGAFAGGFISGGLGTAFHGGNFFQNAFVGAIGNAVVAAAVYGVMKAAGQLYQKWNEMAGTRASLEANTKSSSFMQLVANDKQNVNTISDAPRYAGSDADGAAGMTNTQINWDRCIILTLGMTVTSYLPLAVFGLASLATLNPIVGTIGFALTAGVTAALIQDINIPVCKDPVPALTN